MSIVEHTPLPQPTEDTPIGTVARGSSARRAAAMMNWGNIIAFLLPFPLLIFWFGASIMVYAMNKHHPNPKVGHYTQWAAYRLYGVTGSLVVVGTFFPGSAIWHYLAFWGLALAIVVPWSVIDLIRIRRDEWVDIPVEPANTGT